MRIFAIAPIMALMFATAPATASTFAPVTKTCPVGGQKFRFMEQMSSTSWGQLPDGMPLGTGPYPTVLPQCPKNGLGMYRDFDAAAVKQLAALVACTDYQALRTTETPHYLAYWLARQLGDTDQLAWLLMAATWEAKNSGEADPRAKRYAEEFVTLIRAAPVSASSFESIALRARSANALRELGRFSEAETLRASIVVPPNAGGTDSDAAENREGWTHFLSLLAAPIARSDPGRQPIDMLGEREAMFQCLRVANPQPDAGRVVPLTPFETSFCARPEMIKAIAARHAVDDGTTP